ncbi:MAG: DUF6527 family protein [Prevotellaceae bacterium]|nr:DUF6527 family protein [Prevotellaceae bacterium]
MKKINLQPVFVKYIPTVLESKKLYISMECNVAVHICACGCGREVVTPLAPEEWELTYDGKRVSLYPSIGNYNFPCKSHYFIKKNKVIWIGNNRKRIHWWDFLKFW